MTYTPVIEYLIKNIGKSFVILGELETENYTLAWCSKEDKISSETQNFFEKFNKEVVKPENEILKSFSLIF